MKIKLELEIEEFNVILNSLGKLPYVQVFELIEKMKTQATGQIETNNK